MAGNAIEWEIEEEDSESDISLSYDENTTAEQRRFDGENLFVNTPAVFPELPEPFNHIYFKVNDLNEEVSFTGADIDNRPEPSVEVGLKFTF